MSGEEKESEPKYKSEETKKLIDWALQSLVTWSVILLTCFIGLIELLPEIKLYSDNIWGTLLSISLSIVYLILVLGLCYSFFRISTMFAQIWKWQHSLKGWIWEELRCYRGVYEVMIIDKEGTPRIMRLFLVSLIVAILWFLILISKILLSL